MRERLSSREKAGLDNFYSARLGRCRGSGDGGRVLAQARTFDTLVRMSSGGDDSEGETPGPIPNPAVKPFSADGSWSASSCESRSSPTELVFQKLKKLTPGT